jgi:ADP-ribose pyrophosphatase
MRKRSDAIDQSELTDRPAELTLSAPELLAKGYRDYQRYRLTLRADDGSQVSQTRDVLLGGKVIAVLPLDLARDEIVLIRQFRLGGHLATGNGDMIEIVAGRVEAGERAIDAARRECREEIGVAPGELAELFTFMTTPGVTDEEITVFLAAVDASHVPPRTANADEGERIETLRVSIDAALVALNENRVRFGPMLIVLQWLALNRHRLAALLGAKPAR